MKQIKYKNHSLMLWLADKIVAAIGEGKEFAGKAFKVVEKQISKTKIIRWHNFK